MRWGDALAEAGFEANEFRSAYPDEYLLEKLATLVRELNHFPLVREIKMKSRREKGFPAEQAFRRLGNKAQLAAKLLEFSRTHGDFADVAEIASPHAAAAGNQTAPEPAAKTRVVGEVYLLKSGRFYKIGKTNAIGRREYEIGLQLPEKASLVHAIKTDDPTGIELYWHRRFQDRRKNGEWFELTTQDVAAFKWRKFM